MRLNKNANPIVTTKVIASMSNNCRLKLPTDSDPILSLRVIKLKRITPKISDKLLSYVINSLLLANKCAALGMAIALLMIANGIALANPFFNGTPSYCCSIYAIPNASINIGINAITAAFPMTFNLDALNSSSKDPSRTIRINPMVPSKGSVGARSGIDI